jgi:uncharacterized membrane protein
MRAWTFREVDRMLARVLRIGVVVAGVVVAAGGAVYLGRNGRLEAHYAAFVGEPEALRSVTGIVGAAGALSGRGIIQLGLLLLIATPIARVAAAVLGFVSQRDWLYAAFGVVVLLLLAYSAFGA